MKQKIIIILDIICGCGWIFCAAANFIDGSIKKAVCFLILAVLWLVMAVINIIISRSKKD